ncbi:flavocytochrome c [Turicimonas muris]|uniref:flavocytochrome c n=1 Tax=Turicimonas muris TaxID=1796652 RepID=UPI0023F520C5|nr:flavocytochrome c [Turicimonas muris]
MRNMPLNLTAIVGLLLACHVEAQENQVFSYTVSAHNAPMTVDLIVKDGKIANILTDNRESPGVGKFAISELSKKMIRNQTINVDNVSGASVTSFALKYTMRKNLEKAGLDISKFNKPLPKQVFQDSYKGEVVIVGGGGAGLAAAAAVIEAGGSVIIVEKLGYLGGSTVVSGGGYNAVDPKRQSRQGIEDSLEKHYQDTMRGGHNKNNPALVKRLVEKAPETMHWLEEKGLGFSPKVRVIVGGLYPRGHGAEGGGYGYIRALENFIKQYPDKVKIFTDTRATELIVGPKGEIVGVKGIHNEKPVTFLASKGVIITTGGFGSNIDLRQAKNTGVWKEVRLDKSIPCTNNFKASQGDGLILAEQVGANVINLDDIQLHPGGTPKTGIMSSWPSGRNRIFLTTQGDRFVNEDAARDTLCKAIFKEGGRYWIVSNHVKYPSLDSKSKNLTIGEMIQLGQAFSGTTIEELAQKTGMDPKKLRNSINAYNEVVQGKVKEDKLGFKKLTNDDQPMTEGPFYATPMVPAVHHTMGGIEINADAQVLNKSGKVIPGLFAAGEVTGGVHGSNRVGGNGIADAMIFGRIAGESAEKLTVK